MGNHLPVKKGLSASIPKPWVRYYLEDSPLFCLFCYVVSAPSGNDDTLVHWIWCTEFVSKFPLLVEKNQIPIH